MEVLIDYDYREADLEDLPLKDLALFIMSELNLPNNAEVSITFVDNDEMAILNENYRGKVGPTDVLSFECDNIDDDFDALSGKATLADDGSAFADIYELGDIIIAPDVAKHQCEIYETNFEGEISLLITHGLLHLCGFDHLDDEQAQLMEQREYELLQSWGDRGHEAVRYVRKEPTNR